MATATMISRALIVSALLISACKSSAQVADAKIGQAEIVRVCDVRSDIERYVGSVVRIHATYKSDHMYYSYLLDESCASRRAIEVDHPLHTHGDDSVRKFFSMEDDNCAKMGGSVCPIAMEVTVDALIKKQSDGQKVIAELKSVTMIKPTNPNP